MAGVKGTPGGRAGGGKKACARGATKDGPQVVMVDPAKSVSEETKAMFIATLAASANIRFAAAQAGFDKATFYYHRSRDAAFARAWDEAKAEAVESVEFALVRRAREALSARVPRLADGGGADARKAEAALIPALTVDQAISIVRLFRGRDAGGPSSGSGNTRSRRHWHWTPMDPEKAREVILKNVETARRARIAREGGA